VNEAEDAGGGAGALAARADAGVWPPAAAAALAELALACIARRARDRPAGAAAVAARLRAVRALVAPAATAVCVVCTDEFAEAAGVCCGDVRVCVSASLAPCSARRVNAARLTHAHSDTPTPLPTHAGGAPL